MPVKALLRTSADPVRDDGWLDSTRPRTGKNRLGSEASAQVQLSAHQQSMLGWL